MTTDLTLDLNMDITQDVQYGSTSVTRIPSSGIRCKGQEKLLGSFEQISMTLFDYLQLELITKVDMVVYIRLMAYYNKDYGYAFPTIRQLKLATGIEGNTTIQTSLKNLQNAGLIEKGKGASGNNIYVVFRPLEKAHIYSLVPHRVKKLKEKEMEVNQQGIEDWKRLQLNQNQQEKVVVIEKVEVKETVQEKVLPKPRYDLDQWNELMQSVGKA